MIRSRMRNIIGTAFLVGLTTFAIAQEAPISNPDAIGGVFQVNDGAVTSSEIIENLLATIPTQLAQWRGALSANEFVTQVQQRVAQTSMAQVYNLLLFQHAKQDFSKNENFDAMVDAALAEQRKKIINQHGGNEAEAIERLQKSGTTFEILLEEFRHEMVIASYRQTYFVPTRNITRAQMLQYYRKHLTEKYSLEPKIQFQLIDIPFSDTAEQQAQEAHEKIVAGAEFTQMVAAYSQGFRKSQEGFWRPMDPTSLSDLYQPVATSLETIEIGQTTGIIESEEHYFIAKLIDRQIGGTVPFSQVQDEIKAILTNEKWMNYRKQLDKTLLKKATLGNFEKFVLITCHQLYNQLGK